MFANLKRCSKLFLVMTLVLTACSGSALAWGGPGPGRQGPPPGMGRHQSPGYSQQMGWHQGPPSHHHHHYRDYGYDNSNADLALGIAILTAAVVIANNNE
jgi:hypothetical protein